MIANRSMPAATVIPVLAYPDVPFAVAWLCDAFGFAERLRIGDHRAHLLVGDSGAVVVVHGDGDGDAPSATSRHSIMVRIEDAESHCARAIRHGARIARPPADFPYGERQYTAVDPGGHVWTFSQSMADVPPESWGGDLRDRAPT